MTKASNRLSFAIELLLCRFSRTPQKQGVCRRELCELSGGTYGV